nr:MAG TPA: hypothetical protein [Caudoviricetes sp.]
MYKHRSINKLTPYTFAVIKCARVCAQYISTPRTFLTKKCAHLCTCKTAI